MAPDDTPSRPQTSRDDLGSIAAPWALTLTEPLLPTAYRAALDTAMAELCVAEPVWSATLFGGVLADVVRSLPDGDAWRQLCGRLPGQQTDAPAPPLGSSIGAWHPSGLPFGSITDAQDILPPVFEDALLDPALAALAFGLRPPSAALLAFAEAGWQACSRACQIVATLPTEPAPPLPPKSAPRAAGARILESIPPDPVIDPFAVRLDTDDHHGGLFAYAADALRWAAHRRRTRLGVEASGDGWIAESIYRWIFRATRVRDGLPWPQRAVERGILEARIIDPGSEF